MLYVTTEINMLLIYLVVVKLPKWIDKNPGEIVLWFRLKFVDDNKITY